MQCPSRDRTSRMRVLPLLLIAAVFMLFPDFRYGIDEFTFAVFGDSRPGKDLKQPRIFSMIVDTINQRLPDAVFHVGDIIYGKTEERKSLKEQYSNYFKIAQRLKMKMFIAAGNHDVWDENSAAAFKEQFGYLYTSVTFGKNHFILLNSELPHHECMIDGEQLAWLEKDLSESSGKGMNIFIVIHRPMFPVDGYKAKSMDKYPEKRDQLHALFRKYGVRCVFSGHEHIYNETEKDGIKYIIAGGGGAPLYADEDKGGFYHILFFTVKDGMVSFEVKKLKSPAPAYDKPPISKEGTAR